MAGVGSGLLMIIGGFWLFVVLILFLIDKGSSGEPYLWLFFITPGFFTLLLGFILFLLGKAQIRKNQKILSELNQTSQNLERSSERTKARVVYVDKNYGLLINNVPVYSIIEYQFTDDYGRQHTGKKPDVPSDLVVRQQIEVGSEVDVIYNRMDPDINNLVLNKSF